MAYLLPLYIQEIWVITILGCHIFYLILWKKSYLVDSAKIGEWGL